MTTRQRAVVAWEFLTTLLCIPPMVLVLLPLALLSMVILVVGGEGAYRAFMAHLQAGEER